MKKIPYLILFLLTFTSSFAQSIEVERISDNLIIITEDYFRSVAILTDKGVVLIDTREPLEKMEEIKLLVKKEFNTDTFCYIINTHGCPEHILGNPAFPETPVIMNENFFKRKAMFKRQIEYVDSLETACYNIPDTVEWNKSCNHLEQGKNWREYCIKAMKIKPDITWSERLNLYFEDVTIELYFTGLMHGYSTFIYIPEQQFLHTSTLGSFMKIPKIKVPPNMDSSEFMPYQIKTLKHIISLSDSLTYVAPCHGEKYSPDVLKQKLSYYTTLYDFALKTISTGSDYNTFKSDCSIENLFPEYELFEHLDEKDLQQHEENIDWLWRFCNK